ncbi:membrane lipoprotein lipid attachment site-containing protein [Paenibacillus glacialis]|uniref:Lipoprotein n=1 Tax=Paenibacillus glacialis TaxID=494026 RepID=A0A168N0U1_9BACL|nr:membrane lipoprotein lipid attachment site-containing protein [Paenibacillus glacialis]OAB45263.1 hypothetical protein PGLA_03115 [Paenibacillus glacialis]
MKKIFPFILFILVILAGCTTNAADTVDTPLYAGKPLVIGIIGDSPAVRENNVEFKNITFKQLEEVNNQSSELDAIMIMKEHLSEAAESKYAKVYKNPSIPYFFIESTKSYVPFIIEELSYEEVPELDNLNYVTGYFNTGADENQFQSWGYGLYNDKVNESNIKNVYTQIFTTIASSKI